MLIHCPECRNQVSDKAISCPTCGYPLKSQAFKRNRSKRRLPNGFGSITYIKGKHLRNPYLARVTVGKTDTGKPITKNLKPQAYFRTYNDAYSALIEYNKDPYSFEASVSTEDVLKRYLEHIRNKEHPDKYLKSADREYRRSEPLYKINFRDLRPRHLKELIEGISESPHVKVHHKQFWNQVFDFAIEYEIVEHNYARDFTIDKSLTKQRNAKNPHLVFTDEEMEVLWDNAAIPVVQMILVQCYMGWRPKELVGLTKSDVDLDNWTIRGGIKTEAGIDRVVPIHSKIQKIVEDAYASSPYDYLFVLKEDKAGDYFYYYRRFGKIMTHLGLNAGHRPHDPRKQFVTMAKRFKVDDYVIKRLVGHTITDITEAVYTERDIKSLRREIEKITL